MADQKLVHQKKCPTCKKWSEWHLNITDRCQHCNALLDADSVQRQAKREEDERKASEKFQLTLIEIHPTDSSFTKFYKRIIQAFQIAFIATLSFIIWLITLLAG